MTRAQGLPPRCAGLRRLLPEGGGSRLTLFLLFALPFFVSGLFPCLAQEGDTGSPWGGGPLEVAWNDDAGRAVALPLLTSGEHLFVTTTDRKLLCYDLATGKKVWKRRFKIDLPTGPAILAAGDSRLGAQSRSGGRVFLQVGAREDAKLYALRADDGEDVWKLPSYPRAVQLLVHDGRLLLIDLAGTVQCLDPDDGASIWEQEGFGWDAPGIVAEEGVLYVLARSDSLVALSGETGERVWSARVPGRYGARPYLDGGRLLLTAIEGQVYEVDTADGAVRTRGKRRSQQLLTPVPIAGRVLTVSSDGWVEAEPEEVRDSTGLRNSVDTGNSAGSQNSRGSLNSTGPGNSSGGGDDDATGNSAASRNSGGPRNAGDSGNPGGPAGAGGGWSTDLGEAVRGTPMAAGGLLLVPTSAGRLVALRGDTGAQVWSLEMGERLATAPLLTDRYLVVATNQGDVYAYQH